MRCSVGLRETLQVNRIQQLNTLYLCDRYHKRLHDVGQPIKQKLFIHSFVAAEWLILDIVYAMPTPTGFACKYNYVLKGEHHMKFDASVAFESS